MNTVLRTTDLTHRYGERLALNKVNIEVRRGEIFGLLGPNGGGKTTLFRILSTLIRPTSGSAELFGLNILEDLAAVRRRMGVVFQSPSLDKKLRVVENLRHQGSLYGLSGSSLQTRINELLARFHLADRARDIVETLSGGLQRRVEIAKSLLHSPEFLLLDEPSTGLDPGARIDLWTFLGDLRRQGVTILLTTHLMDEADRCDRVAIIHRGSIVALDEPNALRAQIGGDVITLVAKNPETLLPQINTQFPFEASLLEGRIRIEKENGHKFITKLFEAFPGEIETITLGKPTLEDVFIAKTGHRLDGDES
jgi:ABC-2 type transport system ATP-binding protein